MPCTTILVGRNASYDGSTIIARNEDEMNGKFTPKRMDVVLPKDQPTRYRSVIGGLEIDLSNLTPQRYCCVPDALGIDGIWAAAGVNECDVAMNATETISLNPRVLGTDPLVKPQPAPGTRSSVPDVPGGIGEEDFVTLVLPYIHSAREGVLRMGELLERYGTYEMNGLAFSDLNEVWWMETIGGHHWIARRVPDDCYVTMPNQLGIDWFDLADAEGEGRTCLCSADLRTWMETHHLDLTMRSDGESCDVFNPRLAFGTASDHDHMYNTPRAWSMQRYLNPRSNCWDGPQADYTPESDDIPWARRPERLITIEDVKYVLSLHYQGTPYDCYGNRGTAEERNRYRSIGINRNGQLAVQQLRPYAPEGCRAVQWMAFGSNAFNALLPLYANVRSMPSYLANTGAQVTTDNFYWTNRLIAALADAHYGACVTAIESYQQSVAASGHAVVEATDERVAAGGIAREDACVLLEEANEQIATDLREKTDKLLDQVLFTASLGMKNAFARSDG